MIGMKLEDKLNKRINHCINLYFSQKTEEDEK